MFDRSFGILGLRLALVCGVCLALAMPLTAQAAGNEVEQTITRAYKDLLGRNPDQDGMRTYRKRMLMITGRNNKSGTTKKARNTNPATLI